MCEKVDIKGGGGYLASVGRHNILLCFRGGINFKALMSFQVANTELKWDLLVF